MSAARGRWGAAGVRTMVAAAGWWALTGGALYGLPLAALSIAAAVAVSLRLLPPGGLRLHPVALLRFVPFFLGESARGGVDVAWRALHPRLPIRPGYATHALRLPPGPARTAFAACVGLFPGTVSTELRGDQLRVHVLDARQPVGETLRRLEARIGAVFGTEVDDGRPVARDQG